MDPDHYMRISTRRKKWRQIGYPFGDSYKSDSEMHGPRWYRFTGKLPEERVEDRSCGTQYPAWIQQEGHPIPEDGIVERTICFGYSCRHPAKIEIAACYMKNEFFYIYKLEKTMDNDSGYCYLPY